MGEERRVIEGCLMQGREYEGGTNPLLMNQSLAGRGSSLPAPKKSSDGPRPSLIHSPPASPTGTNELSIAREASSLNPRTPFIDRLGPPTVGEWDSGGIRGNGILDSNPLGLY